ncbi:TPA: hypothetical protein ACKFWH_002129, partial [Enterobacter hormaechei]
MPVPSESYRDLKYNAGKIDEFVTSPAHTYADRFGNQHWTIAGINYTASTAISSLGYITLDSFEDGNNLTLPNQVLRYEATGEYYRWDGELPKSVAPGSTPETSGGIGPGAWLSVGDASLRTDLASGEKASLVGYGSSTVKDALDSVVNKRVLYFSRFGTLQSLQSYITSNNLKNVEIIFDQVVNFGPGSGGLGTIVTLSNMDWLEIRGLVIRDTLLYSGAFDLTRVFDLTNITNLVFEVDASSTL